MQTNKRVSQFVAQPVQTIYFSDFVKFVKMRCEEILRSGMEEEVLEHTALSIHVW